MDTASIYEIDASGLGKGKTVWKLLSTLFLCFLPVEVNVSEYIDEVLGRGRFTKRRIF